MKTMMRRNLRGRVSISAILALGIGMSVAIFSLVDAVLLRPLPFRDQQAIAVIWKADPLSGTHVEELAYPELADLQGTGDFESVAVMPTSLYGYGKVLQSRSGEPVQIESAPVSHDFFRVLGVQPMIGRDFSSSDERVAAAPVVILSNRVWREQLDANPKILGEMIRLNGQPHQIIGVMAPGVEFPRGAGLWVPLGVDPRIVERRGATFLQAIARLKPARSQDRVRNELNALFQRLAKEHPDAYSPSQRAVVTPLVEYWTGSARAHLWIMLAASLLLWIAAAISAGILMLSRILKRRTEMATRMALGAGRRQILAHVAAQGAVIATLAAAGGLAIAEAVVQILTRFAPADIPRLADAVLNWRAFLFAAGIAGMAAIACSIAPAWFAMRMNLDEALREGGSKLAGSRSGTRMRGAFVCAQAAATLLLSVAAVLLVLSYRAMIRADVGFANRDAVSMNLTLRGPGVLSGQAFTAASRRAFYGEVLRRVRGSPGIQSAAAVLLRPLEGTIGWDVTYQFELDAGANRVLPKANYEVVTPGYFETVGTPILEGRDFDDQDSESSEPVAIISKSLADQIRKTGRSPAGARVKLGLGPDRKVIGVAADARYRSVTQPGPDIFVPSAQSQPPTNYFIVRGSRPPAELIALVRDAVKQVDPNQAISGVATIGELIDRNTARHRFNVTMLLWFGVCALILAAAGIYSVIAETMAEREREMAIRRALGAQRARLVKEMVAATLAYVAAGQLIGVICAIASSAAAADLLYGVAPHDPVVLGGVAGALFALSAVAACWPAWIAARLIGTRARL
jgi:putative ABC transport system permease protein